MEMGAIRAAQSRLAWSTWFEPADGRTDLMRAACFRRLEQFDRWEQCLDLARHKGAHSDALRHEDHLGRIQRGEPMPDPGRVMAELIREGVSPHDVAAAFIYGCLAREEAAEAKLVLEGWAASCPEEPEVAYMAGILWRWLSEPTRAEEEFLRALSRQPRHELAREALARLYEDQYRLDEALEQRVAMAETFGRQDATRLDLARLLRKLGHLTEARRMLEPLASSLEGRAVTVVEHAQIDFASGDYEKALARLPQTTAGQSADPEILSIVATASALQGQADRSARLFARLDSAIARAQREYDLRSQLAVDPRNADAGEELKQLQSSPPIVGVGVGETALNDGGKTDGNSAERLYAVHCAACHGPDGRGDGQAARHLFPRPRDLRTGQSRLVSTVNGVATPADLDSVLQRGMPGTSMPSFENLNETQRETLVQELLRWRQAGVEAQIIQAARADGEEIDPEETREAVEVCTTPGDLILVPELGSPDSRTMMSGKTIYSELGCHHCHGDEGRGPADMLLFDEDGLPSVARDLVRDPFKGGHEAESIYLRLAAGMPGTPHPACRGAAEDQLVDMVQYCLSLSKMPKRALTNYERAQEAAGHLVRAREIVETN